MERLHAIGRHVDVNVDERGGMQRSDTRGGLVCAHFNGQSGWLGGKSEAFQERLLKVARLEQRLAKWMTLKAQRIASGRAKRAERDAKLSSKRAKREAAAAERTRIEALQVAMRYSQLVSRDGYQLRSNIVLQDQLKYHKLVRGAKGFTCRQPNRKA